MFMINTSIFCVSGKYDAHVLVSETERKREIEREREHFSNKLPHQCWLKREIFEPCVCMNSVHDECIIFR